MAWFSLDNATDKYNLLGKEEQDFFSAMSNVDTSSGEKYLAQRDTNALGQIIQGINNWIPIIGPLGNQFSDALATRESFRRDGYDPDDPRIKEAYEYGKQTGGGLITSALRTVGVLDEPENITRPENDLPEDIYNRAVNLGRGSTGTSDRVTLDVAATVILLGTMLPSTAGTKSASTALTTTGGTGTAIATTANTGITAYNVIDKASDVIDKASDVVDTLEKGKNLWDDIWNTASKFKLSTYSYIPPAFQN